ncbi:MAG: methyltransferase domain-containing protein [Deltaproteobacteria bacterium]|nr:MAG: methyltransferase domain-containing protein [Deltaproteobacteria bacterium]
MPRLLYYSTALLTGGCVMALEMVGFRLFAPYFGYSVYVTGSLISVILLAMSVGYLAGGWLADHRSTDRSLFACIFVAACLVALVAWASPQVLHRLQQWNLVRGTLVAAVVLLFLPMLLLSVTSPFLIKLLANHTTVGMTSGQIVALSTLGSIGGTLLATFWMLPSLGVRLSLLSLSGVLVLLATLGWVRQHRLGTVGLLGLSLCGLPPMKAPRPLPASGFTRLASIQSLYSQLDVYLDKTRQSVFVMPSRIFIHSEKPKKGLLSHSEQDAFSVAGLWLKNPKKFLLLGLGAGTTYQQLRHFYPDSTIVGVDLDPAMVRVGRAYFGLKTDKKTRVVLQDARRFLSQSHESFDVIAVNVTAGGAFVPFHLATQEAFVAMSKRLKPKGWVFMNVVDPGKERLITRCILKAMGQTFPHVYSVPFGGNSVVMGSRSPVPKVHLLQTKKHHAPLVRLAQRMQKEAQAYKPTSACPVWTDNRSTIESLTFQTLQSLRPKP